MLPPTHITAQMPPSSARKRPTGTRPDGTPDGLRRPGAPGAQPIRTTDTPRWHVTPAKGGVAETTAHIEPSLDVASFTLLRLPSASLNRYRFSARSRVRRFRGAAD
jgi:hypothetical protein